LLLLLLTNRQDPRQNAKGQAVGQLVEALRYKPEGSGFDSQWCHYYVN